MHNLNQLMTIRDGAMLDPAMTCCRFGLDAQQARRLTALGIHQIMAIVANVGDTTLFPPRRDLLALLDMPLPLTRPLAAAAQRCVS
jgi:hypothetical protein